MKRYLTPCLLLIILLLSLFLELQSAVQGTFAYTYDVGRDMLNVQQIVIFHKLSLIGPTTGLAGVFYGPWWYIMLFVPFILSHGDPRAIDAFMGMTGFATVICMFILGKKIKNVYFGLILAALTAFSAQIVDISTQIWNPNIAFLVVSVILLLFYQIYLEKRSNKQLVNFFLVGILTTLSFDSVEIVYGSVQFIAVLFVICLLLRKHLNLKTVLAFLLGFILIEFPRIFFEIRHHFLMTHTLLNELFTHSSTVVHSSFMEQFISVWQIIWTIWNQTFFPAVPFLSLGALLFTCVGVVYIFRKGNPLEKYFTKIGIIFFITYILILPFFKGTIWDHFFIGLPIIMIYTFGQVFFLFLSYLAKRNMRITFLCVALLFIINFYNVTPKNTHIDDPSVFINEVHVVDYVYKNAYGLPFQFDVYTPPRIPYTYYYLFSWYGKSKYKYVPVSNANLVFYIIEYDNDHPTLRTSWITAHDNTTVGLKQQTLFGNILIQTRKRGKS